MAESARPQQTTGSVKRKKDYRPPGLTDYGNLREIVQGMKGGSVDDGGSVPATKR